MIVRYAVPDDFLYALCTNKQLRGSGYGPDGLRGLMCIDETEGEPVNCYDKLGLLEACALHAWVTPFDLLSNLSYAYAEVVVVKTTVYILSPMNCMFYGVDVSADTPELELLPKPTFGDSLECVGVAATNDAIYVSGGCITGVPQTQVHRYDTGSGSWQQVRSLPVPICGHTMTMVEFRNTGQSDELLVIGGERKGTISDKCNTYTADAWLPFPALKYPLKFHSALVYGGHVVIAGGRSSATGGDPNVMTRSDLIEAIDLSQPERGWFHVGDLSTSRHLDGKRLSKRSVGTWKLVAANGHLLAVQYSLYGHVIPQSTAIMTVDPVNRTIHHHAPITMSSTFLLSDTLVAIPSL